MKPLVGAVALAIALVGMPACAAGREDSRLATLNVKSNPTMPQARVVHDVRRVARESDVVLWQEIAPARYKAAVRSLRPAAWRTAHLRREVPITWRRAVWRSLGGGHRFLSGGVPHVTPNRWATWQVLCNRATGRTYAFVNTHLVSGAWNGHHPATTRLRQRLWRLEFRRLRAVVARLAERYTVVGGGDYNRRRSTIPRIAPAMRWITRGDGIDVLWKVPGHARARRLGVSTDPRFYSDHNAHIAHLRT